MFRLPKDQAQSSWAGYEIGRLALSGAFGNEDETHRSVAAVNEYVQAAADYLRLKSPQYPLPKAMDYMAGRGTSLTSDPSRQQVEAMAARYEAMVKKLARVEDGLARMAFHDVAFNDRSCGTDRLQAVKDCVKALRGA